MKARPGTTSTTTKTSIQALALAVSVLGLVRALILLNATAAGFQSLDPQAPPPPPPPPPPPRDMVALFAMKAIHTLAHITNTYIWPQTDFFFFFLAKRDLLKTRVNKRPPLHTSCKQVSIPADLLCCNQITVCTD